jgi:hypothetical protein
MNNNVISFVGLKYPFPSSVTGTKLSLELKKDPRFRLVQTVAAAVELADIFAPLLPPAPLPLPLPIPTSLTISGTDPLVPVPSHAHLEYGEKVDYAARLVKTILKELANGSHTAFAVLDRTPKRHPMVELVTLGSLIEKKKGFKFPTIGVGSLKDFLVSSCRLANDIRISTPNHLQWYVRLVDQEVDCIRDEPVLGDDEVGDGEGADMEKANVSIYYYDTPLGTLIRESKKTTMRKQYTGEERQRIYDSTKGRCYLCRGEIKSIAE